MLVSEKRFVDQIDSAIRQERVCVVLSPSNVYQGGRRRVVDGLISRIRSSPFPPLVWDVTLPMSSGSIERDIQRIGVQCGLSGISNLADWDDAMFDIAHKGSSITIIIKGLGDWPQKSDVKVLARMLRAHSESFENFKVVLFGSWDLLQLTQDISDHSYFSSARLLWWPEVEIEDVIHLMGEDGSVVDPDRAKYILQICGRHPELVRHCLNVEPSQYDDIVYNELYRFIRPVVLDVKEAGLLEQLSWLLENEELGLIVDLNPLAVLGDLSRILFWRNLCFRNAQKALVWRNESFHSVTKDIVSGFA